MSKKAIFGGLIMALLLAMGLFGNVIMNGQVVQDKLTAVGLSVVLVPLILIFFGFVFEFVKDSLVSFFIELKQKLFKKKSNEDTTTKI